MLLFRGNFADKSTKPTPSTSTQQSGQKPDMQNHLNRGVLYESIKWPVHETYEIEIVENGIPQDAERFVAKGDVVKTIDLGDKNVHEELWRQWLNIKSLDEWLPFYGLPVNQRTAGDSRYRLEDGTPIPLCVQFKHGDVSPSIIENAFKLRGLWRTYLRAMENPVALENAAKAGNLGKHLQEKGTTYETIQVSICADLAALINEGIRAIKPIASVQITDGEASIRQTWSVPDPLSAVYLHMMKQAARSSLWRPCPRCGDEYFKKPSHKQHCGKEKCGRWVRRNKGKV
jgi:hypothetical protein